ncbi:nucleotidyltransferase substrate binding protein [Flavobacterium sp.]|uniref:nucleotidyltransferase substrate binding protein n=1 Tax=Flavobacterium sp. TaxID=239 RepID=UPI0037502D5E
MEDQDIRWKQRFSNFEKALAKLSEVIEKNEELSDLEKEGVIQRFEFTHELSWNVMKDYLIYDGIQNVIGSRTATREAFNKNIISNGQVWMNMIDSRNKTSHTYVETILESEYENITKIYYPELVKFHLKMITLL